MKILLYSFINKNKNTFNEYFSLNIKYKIQDKEDYKEIMDSIHAIYDKYPNLREFIEDEIPMNFGIEETDAFIEVYSLYDKLQIIELLEAFKLGAKEAYIFF